MVFGIGPAGTGKTYLAVAQAVSYLLNKPVTRIILARPAVEAGEKLGFLPGDLQEKVDPYLRPLYDALYDLIEYEKVERLFERNAIEVAPIAFMRGRTLNDAFVIIDEAQNTTTEQMKMVLTRIGFGSKVVVTGDITQIDLPPGPDLGPRGGHLGALGHARASPSATSTRRTSCATGSCRRSSRPTSAAAPTRARGAERGAPGPPERRPPEPPAAPAGEPCPPAPCPRRGGAALGVKGEVSLVLAGDRLLRRLNGSYRGQDSPTDVLSFPGGGGEAGSATS